MSVPAFDGVGGRTRRGLAGRGKARNNHISESENHERRERIRPPSGRAGRAGQEAQAGGEAMTWGVEGGEAPPKEANYDRS